MSWSFEPKKAAQVAAFFCAKANGGKLNVVKLVKLMYLADRQSMADSGSPITHDNFVAMKLGPVVSEAYNYIKGEAVAKDWDDLIADRENHTVGLARPLTDSDDDELSKFEVGVLSKIWEQFGAMDQWALVEWTHKHCPEWEAPNPINSSSPIPYERVFKFLSPETATARAAHLFDSHSLRRALSKGYKN